MGSDLFAQATHFLDTLASQLAPAGKQAWALAAAAKQVHAIASLVTSAIVVVIALVVFVLCARLFFGTLKNEKQGLNLGDASPIMKVAVGGIGLIASVWNGLDYVGQLLDPVIWVSAINGNLGLALTILQKLGTGGGGS